MLAVHLHRARPAARDALGQREAVLGVVDGRREQLRERLGAEPRAHRIPSGHDAWHRHRVDAALRHRLVAFRREEVDGQSRRRPAARVEAVDRAGLRLVVEDEQVAADAVAGRLHQADGGVGGDGGVDRVAAALENLHAGARGQRLAGGDDAEGRGDHRATDDRPAWRARRLEADPARCHLRLPTTRVTIVTAMDRTLIRPSSG